MHPTESCVWSWRRYWHSSPRLLEQLCIYQSFICYIFHDLIWQVSQHRPDINCNQFRQCCVMHEALRLTQHQNRGCFIKLPSLLISKPLLSLVSSRAWVTLAIRTLAFQGANRWGQQKDQTCRTILVRGVLYVNNMSCIGAFTRLYRPWQALCTIISPRTAGTVRRSRARRVNHAHHSCHIKAFSSEHKTHRMSPAVRLI